MSRLLAAPDPRDYCHTMSQLLLCWENHPSSSSDRAGADLEAGLQAPCTLRFPSVSINWFAFRISCSGAGSWCFRNKGLRAQWSKSFLLLCSMNEQSAVRNPNAGCELGTAAQTARWRWHRDTTSVVRKLHVPISSLV